MTNGDRFTGELKAIEKGVIYMENPCLPGETKIPLQSAREIHFRKPLVELPSGEDRISLPKDNVLSGKVVSMDKEKITLETNCVRIVHIKRDMVLAILFACENITVFKDDFSEKNDRWTVHSGN